MLRSLLPALVLLPCWAGSAWAVKLHSGVFCYPTCSYTLKYIHFDDASETAPKLTRGCFSQLGISSLYICLRTYCTPESYRSGLRDFNSTCQLHTNTSLPPFDIIANYTDDDVRDLRKLGQDEFPIAVTSDEVMIPSESLFHLAFDTQDNAMYEYYLHKFYGLVMIYFWAVVISIGIGTKIIALICNLRSQEYLPIPGDESLANEEGFEHHKVTLRSLPRVWFKKHIAIPATFGYRCAQNIGWCTVPPRIQSLTIFAFVLLNVVLCSISYRVFEGNLYWPTINKQLARYISDRTGIISWANFPLIWAFGTRNNVLIWLTGWSFGTYTSFHRWVARVATVQAVIHSIGYTIMVTAEGGWDRFVFYWTKQYWFAGELATIFMCMISIFSVYGLRRSYYEIFLTLHILFSFIALVTMWYHVEIFNGEYDVFFWPCVFFWVLDRFLRVFRILSFNLKFWTTTATTTYNPKSNIVRLTIPNPRSKVKPQPGTYYYLYVLNDLRFWENHPFTLAYATEKGQDIPLHTASSSSSSSDSTRLENTRTPSPTYDSISPSSSSSSRAINTRKPPTSQSEIASLLVATHAETPSLVFLIRPYDGFTSRLRASAARGTNNVRVLVEGPYGHTQPLHTFRTVLFVVGGSGIAVPLSYLDSLLSHQNASSINITILWAVRERRFLLDVLSLDLRAALKSGRVRLSVYITREPAAVVKQERQHLVEDFRGVAEVVGGRPDVRGEVMAAVEGCGFSGEGGKMAVMACGPAMMADEARRAVVDSLGRAKAEDVEYFEESFTW